MLWVKEIDAFGGGGDRTTQTVEDAQLLDSTKLQKGETP